MRLREGGASEGLRHVGEGASRALAGTAGGIKRRGKVAQDRRSHTELKPTGWRGEGPASPGAALVGPTDLLPRPNVHWAGGTSEYVSDCQRGAS